jgi:hypothetical protein
MLLFSLQNMSYFASLVIMAPICEFIIDPDHIRPLQLNYRDQNSQTFFIRVLWLYQAFYASAKLSLNELPNRLLVVPAFMFVFGFLGVVSLYGLRCGNLEDKTKEIEWEALKVKKKMSTVKDLRIDDVINFLEGSEEADHAPEYSLKSQSFVGSGAATPKREGSVLSSMMSSDGRKEKRHQNMYVQEYTPEEDSTRKLIEAHFRGKPMNINFDRDKGEIVITYKNVKKEPSLARLLVCRQMVYIYLR